MTNRQLDMENIDRVDNLVYTPLEKRYLKARIAGTVLAYAGLMVHVAWPGLLLEMQLRPDIIHRIGPADAVLVSFMTRISGNVIESCPGIRYIPRL